MAVQSTATLLATLVAVCGGSFAGRGANTRPTAPYVAGSGEGGSSIASRMVQYNRSRQPREALKLFESWRRQQRPPAQSTKSTSASTPSDEDVISMYVEGVVAHGRLKQPELALECFEQLQSHAHLAPTLLAYTAVIRACATRKLWPVALSLFEDLKADGLSPDTVACNAVLVACERGGQLEEAELLLASMKAAGPPPDAISYNTVISTAARGGNWQQALALLDAMSRGGGSGGGGRTGKGKGKGVVAPDVYSYSAAISACERGGEPEAALETFRRMRESGVAPNTIAYNTAIRACATAALWPIALTLLDDMRDDDVPRSLVSFNAALAACERGGEWQEAQYLLQELGTEGLVADEITYNTAIASARRAGGRPAARFALGLVRRMMRRPHRITPSVIAFTGAMGACNAAGEWRAALALYGRMERAGVRPDSVVIREALVASAGGGEWRTALRLLADLKGVEGAASPPPSAPQPSPSRVDHPGGRRGDRAVRASPWVGDAESLKLGAHACRVAGQTELAERLEAAAHETARRGRGSSPRSGSARGGRGRPRGSRVL